MQGHLELIARQRQQEQSSKVGAGNTSYKETIFEEDVKLKVDGFAYHPNLMDFSLAGVFGLTQQEFQREFDEESVHSSDTGDILEFDLNAQLFKKKPYPGSVFARRERTLTPRAFLSSIETTTTSYGFNWQYVDAKMPTSLQFSNTEVLLDPLDQTEQDGKQKNMNFRFDTGYRFSEQNALSFTYTRQSVEEQPFNLNYDADELTLGHRLDFGEGFRNRLESELNFLDQRGSFPIQRQRWREVLRLQHGDTVKSWYVLELADREQGTLSGVPPLEEKSTLVSATLEHQLYESLTSQLQLNAQRQKFGSGLDIERMGGFAGFDYRKKNPFGVLLANYRVFTQEETRSGGQQTFEILDEHRTFNDPEPIILSNTNIAVSTIFVTAEDRTTLFRDGEDYRIQVVGDQVEIERVPTGRIADGQTVLIDYRYDVGGDFTLNTLSQNFGIRENFSFGLSPYYRLRWQDQELSPADAKGVTPDDITAHLFGAEFSRGPLRMSAEFEDYDSTVNPFEAIRLSTDLRHRFPSGLTGSVKGRWSDIQRMLEPSRETKFFTLEGRVRHPITPKFSVEAAALYRREQDSLNGNDKGVDFDFTLEWFVRQTEVRLKYKFGKFDDNFAQNETSSLFVQVKRKF